MKVLEAKMLSDSVFVLVINQVEVSVQPCEAAEDNAGSLGLGKINLSPPGAARGLTSPRSQTEAPCRPKPLLSQEWRTSSCVCTGPGSELSLARTPAWTLVQGPGQVPTSVSWRGQRLLFSPGQSWGFQGAGR